VVLDRHPQRVRSPLPPLIRTHFIGWALGWMNQIRPENLAVRVKTDVHAPSFLRVTGPVTNMVPFYEAFYVKHRRQDVPRR